MKLIINWIQSLFGVFLAIYVYSRKFSPYILIMYHSRMTCALKIVIDCFSGPCFTIRRNYWNGGAHRIYNLDNGSYSE